MEEVAFGDGCHKGFWVSEAGRDLQKELAERQECTG